MTETCNGNFDCKNRVLLIPIENNDICDQLNIICISLLLSLFSLRFWTRTKNPSTRSLVLLTANFKYILSRTANRKNIPVIVVD